MGIYGASVRWTYARPGNGLLAPAARAQEAATLFRYGLFFAVFCGAGRTSPQGSTVTFLSGILSIAAL
jgi:hypothetical protein